MVQHGPPRRLSRAGWSIVSSKNLQHVTEVTKAPPPELEAEGERLVAEVASSWTSKFRFTIRRLGAHGPAYYYECIFSCPTKEAPVPTTILSTKFALFVVPHAFDGSTVARLLFSFEESDLRHEWDIRKGPDGRLRATTGPQCGSLAEGAFEKYLERVIEEKEKVKERGINLLTSFEATRLASRKKDPTADEVQAAAEARKKAEAAAEKQQLAKPTAADEAAEKKEAEAAAEKQHHEEVMRKALKEAGLYCDKVEPPSSIADLLNNIFDAADEQGAGELPHHEVARLLSATLPGFDLELWDIHLLLTSAEESDEGFIECGPFIGSAPDIIQVLRMRRKNFRDRGLPGVEMPPEAVKHVFSEEVVAVADVLMRAFEASALEDLSRARWQAVVHQSQGFSRTRGRESMSTGAFGASQPSEASAGLTGADGEEQSLVGIKRRFCKECLENLPEHMSPQEAQRLLQMLPEDEDGFIRIDELPDHLESFRAEVMMNALVESDPLTLRTHLVQSFRRVGFDEDKRMKLWNLKTALLQADQVCLTRLQIHTLVSLAQPDTTGLVDVPVFLGLCCTVIPHMFDAKIFVATAERLVAEHAEAMRRSENAELAALGGAAKVGGAQGEDAEQNGQEKTEVDQETVERVLVQVMNLNDSEYRNLLTPDAIFNILQANEKEVQSCQLSDFELCGLAAEMAPDADGLIPYIDHIKKWVPIIFEHRRNRILGTYLQEDGLETLGIVEPDLEQLEALYPLVAVKRQPLDQRSSRERLGSAGTQQDLLRSLSGSDVVIDNGNGHNSATSNGGAVPEEIPPAAADRGKEAPAAADRSKDPGNRPRRKVRGGQGDAMPAHASEGT